MVLVAFCWTLSRKSMSLSYWGAQNWTPHCRCGLTSAVEKDDLPWPADNTPSFFMQPRILLATFAARAHRWLTFNLGDHWVLFCEGKHGNCWNGECGFRRIGVRSDAYSLLLTLVDFFAQKFPRNVSPCVLVYFTKTLFLCINLFWWGIEKWTEFLMCYFPSMSYTIPSFLPLCANQEWAKKGTCVHLCRFMGSDGDENEDIEATMMYYGTTFIQEADFPFNFNLINMKNLSGNSIFEAVNLWMKNMPTGKWPNWAVRVLD